MLIILNKNEMLDNINLLSFPVIKRWNYLSYHLTEGKFQLNVLN